MAPHEDAMQTKRRAAENLLTPTQERQGPPGV